MSNTKKETVLKDIEQRVEPIIDFAINIFGSVFRFCISLKPAISKIGKSTSSFSSVEDLIFSDTDNTNTTSKVDITGEKAEPIIDIETNTDS